MANKIRYLPIFHDEFLAAVDYVTNTLKNPAAAEMMLNEYDRAIENVRAFPYAMPPLSELDSRGLVYRSVSIGNYLAFYVVDGDTVEFRRFLHNRSSIPNKLQ